MKHKESRDMHKIGHFNSRHIVRKIISLKLGISHYQSSKKGPVQGNGSF